MAYFEQEDSALSSAAFFYNNSTESHYPVMAHWHYHIEAIYMLSGSVQIFLNDSYIKLCEGDFIQFNPKDIHAIYRCDGADFSYCICRIPVAMFYSEPQHAFAAKFILPYLSKISPEHQIIKADSDDHTHIKHFISILIEEVENQLHLHVNSVGLHCSLIYLFMLRKWQQLGIQYDVTSIVPKGYQAEHKTLLQPCFLFLAENFKRNVSAQEIAACCNFSYSYFAKLFKELTGRTVTQYINYLRIQEAERLLLNNEDNVTVIAMQTGFPDASHFIRSFKLEKGITPKQYQKLVRSAY